MHSAELDVDQADNLSSWIMDLRLIAELYDEDSFISNLDSIKCTHLVHSFTIESRFDVEHETYPLHFSS